MTEKFKESIDKGNTSGALSTDLSKAFDCIDHTHFIAKLSAFGVSPLSLKLLYPSLSNRTQRIKVNENFSDRTDIEFGVPQGSILGPILFNINMIFFTNAKIPMSQVMLMSQHRVHVQQTYLV